MSSFSYSLEQSILLYLETEIKINIFKYVDSPLNLALTCKEWNKIAKDPYAKSEWLIYNFGKTHAMFHGIRLGSTFINRDVFQILIHKKVGFSRYLVQKILIHYGSQDVELVEQKIKHNVILPDTNKVRMDRKKIQSPWASNLPFSVFSMILQQGTRQFSETSPVKGNDMELFHLISGGTLVINYAQQELKNNYNLIKDLIIKYKFVPFPPRPRTHQLRYGNDPHNHMVILEEYPSKDGFENNRQLNSIARAILLDTRFVQLWKGIGYTEICSDCNEHVMSGALIILFPPSPPSGWECPTAEYVLSRLTMLIELGFELNDKSIVDILLIFENKLEEYGDIFWNVFTTIRSNDSNVSLVSRLFKEAFKPSRGLKRILMLGYLKNKSEYAEEILQKIIEETFITEKVEDVDFIGRRKSLILSPTIYQFIIYEYGNESKISSTCFIDILSLKLYLNHTKNPPVSKFTLNSINTTYELYKQGIKYKVENLRHLKAFSRTSIEKLLSNLNG